MRTPFVLVEEHLVAGAVSKDIGLTADRVRHLRRVLRRDDGDELVVTDGAGRVADAVLAGDAARLTSDPVEVPAPSPAITIHHAVPKGRALDDIVRALVELGVSAVHPVITDHTEARPTGGKARSVGDRLRAVAESALQQAQSAHLCHVADPAPLSLTLRGPAAAEDCVVGLVAHPAATATLGAHMATVRPNSALRLLIGPEGGFSDAEVSSLSAAGWTPVRAGSTVLRSVHAATALTAAVLALAGRYGDTPG